MISSLCNTHIQKSLKIKLSKMKYYYFLAILIGVIVRCQQCRGKNNTNVDWFLMINAPRSVSNGYLYFDNTFTQPFYEKYTSNPDEVGSPIHNTFSYINSKDWRYLAWNDQLPNGTTSSVKAHSKGLISFDAVSKSGIFISHSIPKYPEFIENLINITLGDSQRVYAQHLFCISTYPSMTIQIISKINIMRPFIYAKYLDQEYSFYSNQLFQYSRFTINSLDFTAIYKNGTMNGSIFEDGLNSLLKSNIIAQTWGRPIQEPWCGSQTNHYWVGNANNITYDSSFTWKQTQDHSKWAYATDDTSFQSCVGDMNRMPSQWKRGGAYYCLKHPKLALAMRNLIRQAQICM